MKAVVGDSPGGVYRNVCYRGEQAMADWEAGFAAGAAFRGADPPSAESLDNDYVLNYWYLRALEAEAQLKALRLPD